MNTAYAVADIAKILGCSLPGHARPNTLIKYLSIDSRRIHFPRHTLFFALKGLRRDGHQFVTDAYRKGVRHFVVAHAPGGVEFPEAIFFPVADTLKALQQIAAHQRRQLRYPIIGITGSNGKTIVKEWLYQLLSPSEQVARSPGSYNSQIGVPLALWQMEPDADIGLVEAGISQMGEMQTLAQIIHCDWGIFTNIGSAHDAGFPHREVKAAEKAHLFQEASLIFYDKDDPLVHAALSARYPAERLHCWSFHQPAHLQLTIESQQQGRTQLRGRYEEYEFQWDLPFADKASLQNALHCALVLLKKGWNPQRVLAGLQQLQPVEMRLEIKPGLHGCRLLNDSYNMDLTGLENALDFMQLQAGGQPLVAILSDLLEAGQPPEELYQQVAEILIRKDCRQVWGVGNAIAQVAGYLPEGFNGHFFEKTADLLEALQPTTFQHALILIKGARTFRFEQITQRLSSLTHRTVLETHLSSLRHNLGVYTHHLAPRTRIMAMVKASAYGSGSEEVARFLEHQEVQALAVAYTDEGVALRKAGITLPILVLNPEPPGFPALAKWSLEPEVYSLEQLQALLAFAKSLAQPLPVQLKINTGMHRLGFSEKDLTQALQWLKGAPVEVSGVFSHLSAADDPNHDDFSHTQAQRFLKQYARIEQTLGYSPVKHLLNSAGLLRFPQYQFDMVRLGIGLYGIDPTGQIQLQLEPVLRLKSRVSQIHPISAGSTVGYNRGGYSERARRIATIAIGYADGLPRLAGNGQFSLWINGHLAPITGDVCMDMCMVDVSEIPHVEEGQEVEVFGLHQPVTELARAAQTIPYEIFTSVSQRVKRIYLME